MSDKYTIDVVGDISIEHFVFSEHIHEPMTKQGGLPDRKIPTNYRIINRSQFRMFGGFPWTKVLIDKALYGIRNQVIIRPSVPIKTLENNKNTERHATRLYWELTKHPKKPGNKDKVFRMSDTPQYINFNNDFQIKGKVIDPKEQETDCTVLVDRNFGFRHLHLTGVNNTRYSDNKGIGPVHDDEERAVKLIVSVDNQIPNRKDQDPHAWEAIKSVGNQAVAVVSANLLRASNCPISRRVSWERTVADYLQAFYNDPQGLFTCLKYSRYLVVKFGVSGAIITKRKSDNPGDGTDEYKHWFVFHPDPQHPYYRDHEKQGRMRGNKSIYMACLLHELINPGASTDRRAEDETELDSIMIRAVEKSIIATQKHYDEGIAGSIDSIRSITKKNVNGWTNWLETRDQDEYNNIFHGEPATHGERYLARISIDDSLVKCCKKPSETSSKNGIKNWTILGNQLKEDKHAWIECAKRLILRGPSAALNSVPKDEDEHYFSSDGKPYKFPNIVTPVVRFGNLCAVYRQDIENLNSIRNMFYEYHANWQQRDKPISVAVFGMPGTGKSFAVKEIAKEFKDIEPVAFNMAQFEDIDQLALAFAQVRDMNIQGKLPLVFFDEFDCMFEGRRLGWLKYFLAPMEDGEFETKTDGKLHLGRGIFVFAGGTCTSFKKFEEQIPDSSIKAISWKDPHSQKYWELQSAKLRDFVSRLRGCINVPGLTHVEDDNNEPDFKFLQRAIILRSMLVRKGLVVKDEDGKTQNGRAMIDEEVVDKLLKYKSYKYGARSLAAILDMCLLFDDWVKVSSMPTKSQLNMHADTKEVEIK